LHPQRRVSLEGIRWAARQPASESCSSATTPSSVKGARPARRSAGHHRRRGSDPAALRPARVHTDGAPAREREVLKLIAGGNINREIAGLLCLSRKTVETQRGNIMDRLDLHNVAALAKYVIREGLIGLE
jgi:DNA-binding NarL/FixJ family response regulator